MKSKYWKAAILVPWVLISCQKSQQNAGVNPELLKGTWQQVSVRDGQPQGQELFPQDEKGYSKSIQHDEKGNAVDVYLKRYATFDGQKLSQFEVRRDSDETISNQTFLSYRVENNTLVVDLGNGQVGRSSIVSVDQSRLVVKTDSEWITYKKVNLQPMFKAQVVNLEPRVGVGVTYQGSKNEPLSFKEVLNGDVLNSKLACTIDSQRGLSVVYADAAGRVFHFAVAEYKTPNANSVKLELVRSTEPFIVFESPQLRQAFDSADAKIVGDSKTTCGVWLTTKAGQLQATYSCWGLEVPGIHGVRKIGVSGSISCPVEIN